MLVLYSFYLVAGMSKLGPRPQDCDLKTPGQVPKWESQFWHVILLSDSQSECDLACRPKNCVPCPFWAGPPIFLAHNPHHTFLTNYPTTLSGMASSSVNNVNIDPKLLPGSESLLQQNSSTLDSAERTRAQSLSNSGKSTSVTSYITDGEVCCR